jgi:hypothetical protein
MSDYPTPRTDAAILASKGQWSFELRDCSKKLERELAEAQEQRDYWEAENTLNLENLERTVVIGEKLVSQRDMLVEKIKDLQYWHDISECDCQNSLPQGGCLKCDLVRILSMVNGD